MWPKMIQVNKTDVYILGGNNTSPELQNNPNQKTRRKVFKLNLQTLEVHKMKSMTVGKQAFGVCCVCGHIIVVGGFCGEKPVATCERYDILSDSW